MRRMVLAILLGVLSVLGSSALAPVPFAHASVTTATSPTVTVNPSTVVANNVNTVTVNGSGFGPNYYAYVYYQRPNGTYNTLYVRTDANGNFSFQLGFSPANGSGTEYVSAYDFVSQRWAPFATITVTTAPTPGPTLRQLSASPNPVRVGQTTTITGTGFSPNNYVYFYYQRPDGSTNAFYIYTNTSGGFSQQLGFLASHGCGTETITVYDYGTQSYASQLPISVTGC